MAWQLRVAYLVSPTLRNLIEVQPDFQPAAAYEGRPFTVGFFSEAGATIAWLNEAYALANQTPTGRRWRSGCNLLRRGLRRRPLSFSL
jgi:hypothetical protein